MNKAHLQMFALAAIVLLVSASSVFPANTQGAPAIGAPLVREGAFAVELAGALDIGTGLDEMTAESLLGELGIAPRNGWIADYPMTPDIIGELQQAIIDAADNSRLPMDRDEALQIFYDAAMETGLSVVPYADDSIRQSSSEDYPGPATVNNYYYNYGPPVVTYYAPPPDYSYLYAWVPFPFWSWGFWFPGFYVLHDFHKTVVIDRRAVCVSNHYSDPGHRALIVDPMKRFHNSGTVYGIGAPHNRKVVYKGSPNVARRVLDRELNRKLELTHSGTMHPDGKMIPAGRTTVTRPLVRGNENSRPPVTRTVNAPAFGKKGPMPQRNESNRTVQAGTMNHLQNKAGAKDERQKSRIEREARPLAKSIESRSARPGRAPGQAEQKIAGPQISHTGTVSSVKSVNQAPPRRDGRAPAVVQPQQRSQAGGPAPSRANQQIRGSANSKAQGNARGNAHGNDRKESPPRMTGPKGPERGGRG